MAEPTTAGVEAAARAASLTVAIAAVLDHVGELAEQRRHLLRAANVAGVTYRELVATTGLAEATVIKEIRKAKSNGTAGAA